MGFLRGIGWALLLIAIAVIAYGVVIWQGGVPVFEQTGGEYWFQAHLESLNLTQAVIQRYLHPAIWDPFLVNILLWPVAAGMALIAAVFAVPGIVLISLFRRRRRRLMR